MNTKLILATVVITGCLFCLVPVTVAQDPNHQAATPAGEPNAAPKGVGRIRFEQLIHNFGNIGPDTKNDCQFKFCNNGDANLIITRIDKSCGCTVTELGKKEYAPGECGALKATYAAPKVSGLQTRYIYVITNDPNNERVQLTINATIVQKVNFEPQKLQYSLKGANAGQAELKLIGIDNLPFAVTAISATGDAVSAPFDPAQKATQFVLNTKISPDKMGGSLNGRIEINLTHPECPTLIVPFTVLPEFTVNPPSINVLNAQPQQPTQKELWVLNNYGEDFEIDSVTSKDGLIKTLSKEKIDNRYKLNLEITPPPTETKSRVFTDTLTITIKGGQKIDVPCRGFYARQ